MPSNNAAGRLTRRRKAASDSPVGGLGQCPVTPLGHRDGRYYFFAEAGYRRSLTFRDLASQAGQLALFAGNTEWLIANFPSSDRRGEGVNTMQAAAYLMAQCDKAGIYDEAMPARGIGVWPGENGPIIHCGDAVYRDDKWCRPGLVDFGRLYEGRPAICRPADIPATAEDGQYICKILRSWCWADTAAPEVVAGFIAQGFVLGTVNWRSHVFVSGPRGSGKSLLIRLIAAALGPLAIGTNDFTSAGIRQALGPDARAMLLDEAEAGKVPGQKDSIMELVRFTSGGDGAQGLRGTPDGSGRRFDAISAFFLAAIVPPRLAPQDASRVTCLELHPLADDANADDVEKACQWLGKAMPSLWARIIQGIPRAMENIRTWRKVFQRHGRDHRQAEQAGTLLGFYYALVQDEVISEALAEAELPRYEYLFPTYAEALGDSGACRCIDHLWSMMTESQNGARPTVGSLVLGMWQGTSQADAKNTLRNYGMIVDKKLGGVFIANQNPNLARLFEKTPWADYGWGGELKRLPGACAWKAPKHLSKITRVTFIPFSTLELLGFGSDPCQVEG